MPSLSSCAVVLLLGAACTSAAAPPGRTGPYPKIRTHPGNKNHGRDAKALGDDDWVDELYLHMAPLFDNIIAWSNLPGSEMRAVPEILKHLHVTFGSWSLPEDAQVTFSCPDAPDDIDVCDAWVFYYTCSSCNDHQDGPAGGLAALLAVDPDWEAVRCAPSFTNGVTEAVHPMQAFRRQLQPGGTAELNLPNVGEFLAFGLDAQAINCEQPQYNTVLTCPVDGFRCKWEGGVCKNQNCAKRGAGPQKGCPLPCPSEGVLPSVYEAEDNTDREGCQVATEHAGFSGTGFMDFGGKDTWIEWNNVDVVAGRDYRLSFTYAAGSTPRPSTIYVNGQDVGEVSFPTTGAWTTYSTDSIAAALQTGVNTIRVTASTNAGGPNLDKLVVTVARTPAPSSVLIR